jgi:hypothetical protein
VFTAALGSASSIFVDAAKGTPMFHVLIFVVGKLKHNLTSKVKVFN